MEFFARKRTINEPLADCTRSLAGDVYQRHGRRAPLSRRARRGALWHCRRRRRRRREQSTGRADDERERVREAICGATSSSGTTAFRQRHDSAVFAHFARRRRCWRRKLSSRERASACRSPLAATGCSRGGGEGHVPESRRRLRRDELLVCAPLLAAAAYANVGQRRRRRGAARLASASHLFARAERRRRRARLWGGERSLAAPAQRRANTFCRPRARVG